jgi:thiol-disulfide isomerase/thioredoxin
MISTVLKRLLKPLAIVGSLTLALNTSSAFAVSAGDTAPNFKLPRLERSGDIQLSSFLGKVVYVDFWASWCGPCRQSLPALNTIYKELRKKDFLVIAINLDEEKSDAMEFLKEFPVAFPTARDVEGITPDKYGLQGMPTAYLIDREGNVSLVHEGFKKTDSEELNAKIITLLKKK